MSTKGLTKKVINWYSIFKVAKYFTEDGSQSYFTFQPLFKYFKASRMAVNGNDMAWKY